MGIKPIEQTVKDIWGITANPQPKEHHMAFLASEVRAGNADDIMAELTHPSVGSVVVGQTPTLYWAGVVAGYSADGAKLLLADAVSVQWIKDYGNPTEWELDKFQKVGTPLVISLEFVITMQVVHMVGDGYKRLMAMDPIS